MLAMANKNGSVFASEPGLASRAKVSLEATLKALEKFQQPDQYSRSKEYEGRRIEVIDGGWRLLNYAKHRAIRDEDDRREYMKLLMREVRKRKQGELANVSKVIRSEPSLSQAEAEAEAEKRKVKSVRAYFALPSLGEITSYCEDRKAEGHPGVDPQQFFNHYTANGWMVGKVHMKDWRAAVRKWERSEFRNGGHGDNHETAAERRNREQQERISRAFREAEATDDKPATLFKTTQ